MIYDNVIEFTISIHSPRMGRDHDINLRFIIPTYFNPLSPHGERPQGFAGRARARLISIHSPRMGRDSFVCAFSVFRIYFNPLSPHGERLHAF